MTPFCVYLLSTVIIVRVHKNDSNRNEFSKFVIHLKLIYSQSQLFDESMLGDFIVAGQMMFTCSNTLIPPVTITTTCMLSYKQNYTMFIHLSD